MALLCSHASLGKPQSLALLPGLLLVSVRSADGDCWTLDAHAPLDDSRDTVVQRVAQRAIGISR